MAIDQRNMLPGYSSQQLCGMAGAITVDEDGGRTRQDVGVALLRDEQLIDVGFLVYKAPTTGQFTVSFGLLPPGTDVPTGVIGNYDIEFTAAYTVNEAVAGGIADGAIFRVGDGSLSWTTVAARKNTEAERNVPRGSRVYVCIDDVSQEGAIIYPFCIMRPNESLDPIA